jgi:D-glycero-D-manno-heptose 1,7-bisphosphate phosphatase
MGVDPLIRRAVFLDRDGVINRAVVRGGVPRPPSSPSELEILPGVPEALARLKSAGFRLVVVTNQPDVSRGVLTLESVEAVNAHLSARLPIDEIRICWHDDADRCSCRKPKPGMLLDAAREARLDLSSSYMVGDRWRDIGAGKAAGCATVFIDSGYAETPPEGADAKVGSLMEAAEWILARDEPKEPDGKGRNETR